MEKTLQPTVQGNSPFFRWFNKETLWPLRSLENLIFFLGSPRFCESENHFQDKIEMLPTMPCKKCALHKKTQQQFFGKDHETPGYLRIIVSAF